MKLCLALTILGFALVQSSQVQKCPTFCDCVVSGEATCTTLNIEPFPTTEIGRLIIKDPKDPLELTGASFTNLRLTGIREIIIENATVTKLDSTLFTTLAVEKFVLRHSKIPLINKQLFKGSQHIRQVDLSYSKITVFEGVHSSVLDQMVLTGCNLKNVSGALTPNDLPALDYLNLDGNLLEDVKLEELAGDHISLANNKLSKLSLSKNYVETMNEKLVSLRLDGNPLNIIESAGDVNIEELYVKDCHLTDLDFLRFFTSLIKLDATNNLIFELDARELNNLDALEVLILSENLLNKLPDDFGRVMSLTSLVLDKNNLNSLPKFMFQGALDRFSCNACNLTKLEPETFEQMQNTREISLSENNLTDLPKDLFKPVFALVKLDLSHNKLSSLPADVFEHNGALKILDISNNPLGQVDPNIFVKTSIEELHMNYCNLQKMWTMEVVSEQGSGKVLLPHLNVLTAMHNNITHLNITDLINIAKISTLNLLDNHLDCSDDNIKFVNTMSTLGFTFLQSSDCELNEDYSYDELHEYNDPEVFEDQSKEIELEHKVLTNSKTESIDDLSDDQNDDDSYDDEDEDEDEDDDQPIDVDGKELPDNDVKEQQTKYDEFLQDAQDVSAVEFNRFQARQRSSKQMLLFVLPTLVFVLTAMVVLLLTVTVILCIMQKRNGRPTNAPQITILPWGHGQKIKKHSGSIYRPLSEEKIPV